MGSRLQTPVWNMGAFSEARQQGDPKSSGHHNREMKEEQVEEEGIEKAREENAKAKS